MTRQNLWRLIQFAITTAVLWLVVGYVHRYWAQISSVEIHFTWSWAAVASVLVLLSNVIQIKLFQYFLKHNGLPLGLLPTWRIYSLPQAGKYIPGKFAAVAALSFMLKDAGLSFSHALAAIFVFNIVSLLSGLLVGLMMFPMWAPHASPATITLCIGAAALAIPIVFAQGFWKLVNSGLARCKRATLPSYPSREAMIRLMLGWVVYWFVIGSGMFAATRFFIKVPTTFFPLFTAGFSLSYFISTVSFITPAGLGVREALLIAMIGATGTTAVGTIFAAVSRLVTVLDDAALIGGAWLFVKKKGATSDSSAKSADSTSQKSTTQKSCAPNLQNPLNTAEEFTDSD